MIVEQLAECTRQLDQQQQQLIGRYDLVSDALYFRRDLQGSRSLLSVPPCLKTNQDINFEPKISDKSTADHC